METVGLSHAGGGVSLSQLRQQLAQAQSGASFEEIAGHVSSSSGPTTMPADQIEAVVGNTVAVMTVAPEHRGEWREQVAGALQQAQQQGPDWQIEVEFFTAVLAILDPPPPALPEDHPYAAAVARIQTGIASGWARRAT